MEAVRVALICVMTALICQTVKASRPEMAAAVAMAGGVTALLMILPAARETIGQIQTLTQEAGIESSGVSVMLRALGVALIGEFARQLCEDAGESALAGRVALGCRVVILSMSVPLLTELTKTLQGMLP